MKSILLVEDHKELADIFFRKKFSEYEIRWAQNGGEALRMTKEKEPDLIITDLDMPVMNGLAFIKEFTGNSPIIILTNYPHIIPEGSKDERVLHFIIKNDVTFNDVYEMVKKILG